MAVNRLAGLVRHGEASHEACRGYYSLWRFPDCPVATEATDVNIYQEFIRAPENECAASWQDTNCFGQMGSYPILLRQSWT